MEENKEKQIKEETKKDKKVEQKQDNKVQELTNELKRKQADLENYAKRIEKEKQEFIKFSCSKLILEILPIVDELEIAIKNLKQEDKKGIQMILNSFKKILDNNNVKEINTKDQKFDPYKHEVVCSEECEKEENTILEQVQKGYTFHDKIIRFAKVKIAKGGDKK